MKILKSALFCFVGLIAALTLISWANAEEVVIENPIYVNGGIGVEEADAMRLRARDYNLRLYLSEGKKGQSISDGAIVVTDKKGNILVDITNAGPMLFVRLENGTYRIIAQYQGVMFTKTIKIANHKGINVYLNWKNSSLDAED